MPPGFTPDVRSRVVAGLVRRHGPRRLRTVLAAMKVRGMSVYASSSGQVATHQLDDIGHHRGLSGGGNLRAAVFGVNDGLISNASLILGVAGANADPNVVMLTGIAGMCAGALSMAAGGYVFGALAARDVPISDRARARRVAAIPGSGSAGTGADLRRQRRASQGSRSTRCRDASSRIRSMRSIRWPAKNWG